MIKWKKKRSQNPPYGMLKDSAMELTGNSRFEGFGIDIIHELSLMLGFNYEFRLQADGKYGSLNNKTKKWDGMIRELQDGVSCDEKIRENSINSCFHSASGPRDHWSHNNSGEGVWRRFYDAIYEFRLILNYEFGSHFLYLFRNTYKLCFAQEFPSCFKHRLSFRRRHFRFWVRFQQTFGCRWAVHISLYPFVSLFSVEFRQTNGTIHIHVSKSQRSWKINLVSPTQCGSVLARCCSRAPRSPPSKLLDTMTTSSIK